MRGNLVKGNLVRGKRLISFSIAVITVLQPILTPAAEPSDPSHVARIKAGRELFQKEVRQVLSGRCVKCHGADATESEFDLNSREGLLRGGANGPAVVLDDPGASRLLELIEHRAEPKMPANAAALPARQVASIRRWIELGAPYDRPLVEKNEPADAWVTRQIDPALREFWSFQPIRVLSPPAVNNDWCRNDIDRFIWPEFEKHELRPKATAQKSTLLRRVYFDLIGLPPTAAEVQQFSLDTSDNAYERVVDRLLESPRFGERWARHWLDIVRFAESHGFEQDYDRPFAYHYRDFVIWAFNHDLPFDEFIKWQLAGDEWEPTNPYAMMATGFLGAGVFPTQLTEKEFESARYDELDDMLATVGSSMLGLTIGCARCHDHKFDPIPAADYYRMLATFTSAIRAEVELELNPTAHLEALREWEAADAPLRAELTRYEQTEMPKKFDSWLAGLKEEARKGTPDRGNRPDWITMSAVELSSAGGAEFQSQGDDSFLASGPNAPFDKYTMIISTSLTNISGLRLEALAHDSLVKKGPGRAANGNFGLGKITVMIEPLDMKQPPTPVRLVNPRSTFQQNADHLSIAASLDDNPQSGWAVDPEFGKDHAAAFDFAEPVGFAAGTRVIITLDFSVNTQHNIGRPRLALTTAGPNQALQGPAASQQLVETIALAGTSTELSADQLKVLRKWHQLQDDEWKRLSRQVEGHLSERPSPQRTRVMVVTEGQKPLSHHANDRGFPHFYPQTFYLKRGDPAQKHSVAEPGFLQVLNAADKAARFSGQPAGTEDSKLSFRRRAFSNWITDTEQGAGGLLARVIVNRLWQHHFGRGIVATPNDFGAQGERPTHPELLDWLAGNLLASGWRLKSLHKQIVMSQAYQQSSLADERDLQLDPENRWLARRSARRFEAEVLRDAILAVGGTLDLTMYGPGSLDEGHVRRSIYFMVKRSRLIPAMQIFDAPEPLASIGERPSTTVAPQALMFMNNPQVRNAAKSFARRIIKTNEGTSAISQLVRTGYLDSLSRLPSDDERVDGEKFINRQEQRYSSAGQPDARELAVADFCQVLMSLNEFAYAE